MQSRLSWIITVIVMVLAVLVAEIYRTNSSKTSLQLSAHPSPSVNVASASAEQVVLGIQKKSSDCHSLGALPDSECSPGAVFPNVTKEQVCAPGYSTSVRNVSSEVKSQVYQEYGIVSHSSGEYEVDHLISLELGGSNDISNLWPEPASPTPGFHEKDAVENYLHRQVCNGSISLQQAQTEISTNWLAVYNSIPH